MANKQLNLSNLKKLESKLNETIEITLSNSYTIQIDKYFKNSAIEDILEKLIKVQHIVNQNKTDDKFVVFPFEKYTVFLMILNFTSLKNIKINSFEEELEIMTMLINQNLLKEIEEKIEEHCKEEIKNFNLKIVEIMQERVKSLKAQEKFINVLNDEVEKVKEEMGVDNVVDNVDNDNNVDTDKIINTNVGDENSQFGEPTKENREEITTEN